MLNCVTQEKKALYIKMTELTTLSYVEIWWMINCTFFVHSLEYNCETMQIHLLFGEKEVMDALIENVIHTVNSLLTAFLV